jgi:ABC-type antimicrobial peptide transport system permease subunit
MLAQLKSAAREVAPEALIGATWWSDTINDTTAYRNPRFQTIVLTSLGVLALAMTAVGVFGVVNYLVVSHTREMGVRLAIGASPRSLISSVVRSALMPVLVGLGLGMIAIRWISPFAEAQLFKINTHDPLTLALAALTVAIATLAAAYVPARRAAAVDPLAVLRTD